MPNNLFKNGFALIIGVQDDIHSVKDAQKLYDILTNTEKAGYPTVQVQLITEGAATKKGILNAFNKLRTQVDAHPEATVFVYYSGHGGQFVENDTSQYYLVPNDYSYNDYTTYISKKEFSLLIDAIPARKMILIFDCCHAEGFKDTTKGIGRPHIPTTEPLVEGLNTGQGRVIMASCEAQEKSYYDQQKRHGVFTSALIEALEGKNTTYGKKYVSVEDIQGYLRVQVPKRTHQLYEKKQTPIFITSGTGFDVCHNSKPLLVIISDKRDNHYLKELQQSLQILVNKSLIEIWDVHQVQLQNADYSTSYSQIRTANMVICLLSDNYFTAPNNICLDLQSFAIDQYKNLIPILIDDCLYHLHPEYEQLQVLPTQKDSDKPVAIANWKNRKSAYTSIGEFILEQLKSTIILENKKNTEEVTTQTKKTTELMPSVLEQKKDTESVMQTSRSVRCAICGEVFFSKEDWKYRECTYQAISQEQGIMELKCLEFSNIGNEFDYASPESFQAIYPIVGQVATGKAYYLYTLLEQFYFKPSKPIRQLLRELQTTIRLVSGLNYREIERIYKQFIRERLDATTPLNRVNYIPLILEVNRFDKIKRSPINMTFFNLAGELVGSKADFFKENARIYNANAIIILISPYNDPYLSKFVNQNYKSHMETVNMFIDRLYRELYFHEKNKPLNKVTIPIAFCISQFDKLEHIIPNIISHDFYLEIPDLILPNNNLNLRKIKENTKNIENFLNQHSEINIDFIQARFSNYNWFTISSIGHDDVEDIGLKGKTPKGIFAPIFWFWGLDNILTI